MYIFSRTEFQTKKVLGRGEDGESYLLRSFLDGRQYVLKKSIDKERVIREGKILRRLGGKGFPKWYAEYEEGKYFCLVREYQEGETLEEWLKRNEEKLSMQNIVDIMETVLEKLEKLHQYQPPVLYRDVKPKNLIRDREGNIHLMDFGISNIQGEEKQRAGTLGYAAPEQFEEVMEDKNVDIYGAGALLAYLLTGKEPSLPPYNVREECLRDKRITREWKHIVAKSMEIEPECRYPDTTTMLSDIKRAFFEKRKWRKMIHRNNWLRNIRYEKSVWLRGMTKR